MLQSQAAGQAISIKELLASVFISSKKFDNYLNKNKFLPAGQWLQQDTMVSAFHQRIKKKKDTLQTITRVIEKYQYGRNFSFAYQTSSQAEFNKAIKELKDQGFFCGNESSGTNLLLQHKNILVRAGLMKDENDDTLYSFIFHHEQLPPAALFQYAENLLQLTSHENLAAVFGEKNVLKDYYFFSEKEISRCSVLFPRTSRQAVFIWNDEDNYCNLSSILIGGDLPVGNLKNSADHIRENTWMSKEGIYAGMSLDNLIRLNGNDFNFYGKKSASPYMVVPEKTGAIDFSKNVVVLGCLNPGGVKALNSTLVSTGDISNDNTGIYIFMYMILPSGQEVMDREARN
jgi:hypothetical protein